jgi:hypothetical protein
VRRRLINLLTALSLVLWAAVVVLWVRGQFVSDFGVYDGPVNPGLYRRCTVDLYTGYFAIAAGRRYTDSPQEREAAAAAPVPTTRTFVTTPYDAKDWPKRLAWNFGLPHVSRFRGMRQGLAGGGGVTQDRWSVAVPFWPLALALALLPLGREVRRRRVRRNNRLGLCPRCGYDLRATPGRCPECGQVVPAA